MFTEVVSLVLIVNFDAAKSAMEPKVVGYPTDIGQHPHSAFLLIEKNLGGFICGASILNQKILLTAAHCIHKPIKVTVYTGNTDRTLGHTYEVEKVKTHEKYSDQGVNDDIGLILVKKPIKFSKLVQRVSITPYPPMKKTAFVAGWGMIDETSGAGSHHLHQAELNILTHEKCRRIITNLPKGFICAGSLKGKTYASSGDSGSALIVNDYIQIGFVSYKKTDIRNVVAFIDVSYYYSWIELHSKCLYCGNERKCNSKYSL